MTRSTEELLDAMAQAARLRSFDDDWSWRDALFAPSPTGHALSAPEEPDRALLAALAAELAEVDAHRALLADRLHVDWLETILGIPRLPVVPDRVVAQVTVDPKAAAAVVPVGTRLRGGKDAAGNERRYRTLDALTAHGAGLAGVRALVPGGPPSGTPGVALTAPDFPMAPPSTDAEAATAPPAEHVLRVHAPALAFADGDMTATFTFGGVVGAAAAALSALRTHGLWRHPRADGTLSPGVTGTGSGTAVTLQLSGGCLDPDGGDPWVECWWPATQPLPEELGFTGVTVTVTERKGLLPDACFANEGAVDVAKEFEPFLTTAARGDAFYVRCDEAFAKRLATLDVTVEKFASATGGVTPGSVVYEVVDTVVPWVAGIETYVATLHDTPAKNKFGFSVGDLWAHPWSPPATVLRWQRRTVDGDWQDIGTALSGFGELDATGLGSATVGSAPFEVSGQPGRYVRAFLAQGDFGWTAYQKQVAGFATLAVRDPDAVPAMPEPLVAAIYRDLTISYTTAPVPATRLEAWSGWRHTVHGTGTYHPFRRAVDAFDRPAMVAIGLDLPGGVTGSTVSCYLVLDSSAPCGSTEPIAAQWEWWDGAAWQPLPVADGSHGLREAGLLRFVAPAGWAEGCQEVSSATGRWVRFVTDQPRRLGTVRDVVPDAVLAEYASQAADPGQDPTPENPLPPGAVKGTLDPVPGAKKVTNVASVRGRGPEQDVGYAARASAIVRHRGRAVSGWDYEQTVELAFPEVAAVRCLPHTDADGHRAPGWVGLVLVPDRPDDPQPRPDLSLAGRVADALRPTMPAGAQVAVLCPLYEPVTVHASVRLRRGIAALTGRNAVVATLDTFLHPTGTRPTRWGLTLYASTLVAVLERVPVVDVVTSFELRSAGAAVEVVEVDPCRGLYCSSRDHQLACEEQL